MDRVPQTVEAEGSPGHAITVEQDEQVAHGVAAGEHLGAAAPAQERGERVDPLQRANVLELDELGVAVGADQRREIGAVQHLEVADRGDPRHDADQARTPASHLASPELARTWSRSAGPAPGPRCPGRSGSGISGGRRRRQRPRAIPRSACRPPRSARPRRPAPRRRDREVRRYRYSTIFWPPPNRLPLPFGVLVLVDVGRPEDRGRDLLDANPTGITPPYVEDETSRSPRRGPLIFGPLEPNRKPPSSGPPPRRSDRRRHRPAPISPKRLIEEVS